MNPQRFNKGDQVRLRGRENERFTINDVENGADGYHYYIAEIGFVPEEDLQKVGEHLPRWERHTDFLRDLYLAKTKSPLTDSLYSYRASRTEFQPYQFKPVLKFLSNPDRRLLIADEVGLGKTIEAAIIYLEMKARLNISRVLILCPSRLRQKWQDELRNRFDEVFDIWDSETTNRILRDHKKYGEGVSFRAIASFETLRRQERIDRLIEQQIRFDLLIVDEAHHMRNSGTRTHQLGETLANNADAVVFLTATPLNLGQRDLFTLMEMLAPDEFQEFEQFQTIVEPNRYINEAGRLLAANQWTKALDRLEYVQMTAQYGRFTKNPFYRKIIDDLQTPTPQDVERRIRLHREILNLNTLASIFTRTRKREVANAAKRRAFTKIVELSPLERQFYDTVMRYTRTVAQENYGQGYGFFVVTQERMTASCLTEAINAFVETQQQARIRAEFEHESNVYDTFSDENSDDTSPNKITTPETLVKLGRQVLRANIDSKFDALLDVIGEIVVESADTKILLFSSYRRTLKYLKEKLSRLGYLVDTIHGEVPILARYQIIENFRIGNVQILLSSEVGAEGLDFQFCDVLINYDLPWNPMQVEQRIGRLDRFGQQNPVIRIFNFYISDTIETRILERLYDRIQIFEASIGDLEDILGQEIRFLTREVLQKDLTPHEEAQLAEESAQRIERVKIELEEFDKEKDNLIGQDQILQDELRYMQETGRVVYPEEVRALVETYLTAAFPRTTFERDKDDAVWYLELTDYLNNAIKTFARDNRMSLSDGMKLALKDRHLRVTFDSEIARRRPQLEFVTPQHLLAHMAKSHWQQQALDGIPATSTIVQGNSDEVGDGYFFVYAMDVQSALARRTLHTVVILDDGRLALDTARTLLYKIQSRHIEDIHLSNPDNFEFVRLEQSVRVSIRERRKAIDSEARTRNEALIQNRQSSLQARYEAKIRRARQRLDAPATDGKIRTMKLSEITNLEARLPKELADIEKLRQVSVTYDLVACGRITIVSALEHSLQGTNYTIPVMSPNDALDEQSEATESQSLLGVTKSLIESHEISYDANEAPSPSIEEFNDETPMSESPVEDPETIHRHVQRLAKAMTFRPHDVNTPDGNLASRVPLIKRIVNWVARIEKRNRHDS